jgi:arginyl-tRNA synthetase
MPLIEETKHILREAIASSVGQCGLEIAAADVPVETPRDTSHGDLASTVALVLAKRDGRNPRGLAEEIKAALEASPPDPSTVPLLKIEIAGPGFLNFTFAASWLDRALAEVSVEGPGYGRSSRMAGEDVHFEFVSANPTGPLNVVSARAAAVGDALASLCEAAGARVHREFYVNDSGRQVQLLGESLVARILQELGGDASIPENGYHGDYLVEMAGEYVEEGLPEWWEEATDEKRAMRLSDWAVDRIVISQEEVLEHFGLTFDTWFRESAVHEDGSVESTIRELGEKGHTFEEDGALWLRSTGFGDEKDRVLVTSDGRPTYLLPDIAYHRNKFARGWTRLVDLWGPDHHGYIARMSAALQALGHPEDAFEVLIVQQVNLLRSGELVKMSKRAGRLIEMEGLVDEVGVDAARFFFLMRSTSSHLDFDLDLAVSRNEENPVYYVQYAHARICSIVARALEEGVDAKAEAASADLSALSAPEERTLLRFLAAFPETVADAARVFEPHRITNYLRELAAAFHPFYHNHRVLGAPERVEAARLALCMGVRQVLANGLALLGVTAPDRM